MRASGSCRCSASAIVRAAVRQASESYAAFVVSFRTKERFTVTYHVLHKGVFPAHEQQSAEVRWCHRLVHAEQVQRGCSKLHSMTRVREYNRSARLFANQWRSSHEQTHQIQSTAGAVLSVEREKIRQHVGSDALVRAEQMQWRCTVLRASKATLSAELPEAQSHLAKCSVFPLTVAVAYTASGLLLTRHRSNSEWTELFWHRMCSGSSSFCLVNQFQQ